MGNHLNTGMLGSNKSEYDFTVYVIFR